MNEQQILDRAHQLLGRHGLAGWHVQLDHARRRAGCCYHQTQRIGLSKVLLTQYPAEAVDEVILHEIAHALAGAKHKHDAHWKQIARRIGATPRASLSASLPTPTAPWVGTCPECGAQRKLYRVPRRVVSCGACSRDFSVSRVLAWTLHGEPMVPGGAYAKELRRLRRYASRSPRSATR